MKPKPANPLLLPTGFGDVLKHLMTASGCTFKTLAVALNYSTSLINKWTAGNTRPNKESLPSILQITATTLIDSAEEKNRLSQLYDLVDISTQALPNRTDLAERITKILSDAYAFKGEVPSAHSMQPHSLYDNPWDLLEELAEDCFLHEPLRSEQRVFRICSNIAPELLNPLVPILCKMLPVMGDCNWHHIMPMEDNPGWRLQKLCESMAPLLRRKAIAQFFYTTLPSEESAPFLYIEDRGILVTFYIQGDSYYQWIPVSHASLSLQHTLSELLADQAWLPGLIPCDQPEFESHILYFSQQQQLVLASLHFNHFMLAQHPGMRKIRMPRSASVYTRFLRALTHQLNATCVFHVNSLSGENLDHLTGLLFGLPTTDLIAQLNTSRDAQDNNRYFFPQGPFIPPFPSNASGWSHLGNLFWCSLIRTTMCPATSCFLMHKFPGNCTPKSLPGPIYMTVWPYRPRLCTRYWPTPPTSSPKESAPAATGALSLGATISLA